MLPIVTNTIPKRVSKPNKREKKPNALINALPAPLVSFALVRISPSANSTSLSPHILPNVYHAPASSLYIAQPISYPESQEDSQRYFQWPL
jgi:hypothetical protein